MSLRTTEIAEKEYSEANPRTREEFAKELIGAYDGALKMVMGEESFPEKSMYEWLDELEKYVEAERENGKK